MKRVTNWFKAIYNIVQLYKIVSNLTNRVQLIDEPFKYKEGDKVVHGEITGYVTDMERINVEAVDFSVFKDVYTLKTKDREGVKITL